VVQWTTGIVGSTALRAILDDPSLTLVGVFAHSKEKVGQDAGALAGRPDTGVVATDDVTALLNLTPDCIVYMPHWPDIDLLERLLRAGRNVVTTARLVTGEHFPDSAGDRLRAAALAGGATLVGTGMNRCSFRISPWPRPQCAARCIASRLPSRWTARCTTARTCGPPRQGSEVSRLRTTWTLGSAFGHKQEAEWQMLYGYDVRIDAEPKVKVNLSFLPQDLESFDIGITTAMPAINAIRAVVAAAPGVLAGTDLPTVTGRGLLRSR
jgi:hypothetical protein